MTQKVMLTQKVRGIPVYSLCHCHQYLYYHLPGLPQWNAMEISWTVQNSACRGLNQTNSNLPTSLGCQASPELPKESHCISTNASKLLLLGISLNLLQPPSSLNLRFSDNNLLSIPSKPTGAELSVSQPCLPALSLHCGHV